MKGLEVFSQRVREWRTYLKRTADTTNPLWARAMDPPLPLPDDVKLEMMDEDSQLCTDIFIEMAVYGVEFMFDCLKADGFSRGYFLLKSKSCEIDKEEFADLIELLSVGDIFLQNCADMAFEMGADPAYIKETTGVCPRGAGGMSLSDDYIQQPHTQTKDAEPCSNTFLCNGRKGRPKESLKDKMIDDADGRKLQRIHDIWGGRKGKDAALMILVCIKLGWMHKPTYTQVKDEFGDIGSKTGYNRYLDSNKFTDDEIEGVMNILNHT